MPRPKGAKNVRNVRHVKYDNTFSYECADKTRYEAFKALFEAIEQEAPEMVEYLQNVAMIGTEKDWHWFTTWYERMSMEVNVWIALINAVENYTVHKDEYKGFVSNIRDGLLEWSEKFNIQSFDWSFLRQAALLAIIEYHKTKETINAQPTLSLSQNCHYNPEIDTGNKLIPYMNDFQRDSVHFFEIVHPFVFAPPSPTGIDSMPDLPEKLQNKGFAIPIETHPAENLLYRERALIFTSSSDDDLLANELSKWFYWQAPIPGAKNLKRYRGMAYDPREGKEDWNRFATQIREQFEEYLKAYKLATEKWLAQLEYAETQNLHPNQLKNFASLIVRYFIMGKSKDALGFEDININRDTNTFFTRGLGLSTWPIKQGGRPKNAKNKA